jgi:GDP-L-fucose synthase
MLWVLRSCSDATPLILSCDPADEVSIGDVASAIASAMDFKGQLVFDSTQPDGQHRKTASNSRLRQVHPGPLEFTPLTAGIAATVEWFVANYAAARK